MIITMKARLTQLFSDPCLFLLLFAPSLSVNRSFELQCLVSVICVSGRPLTIFVLRIHRAYSESFLSLGSLEI